MMITVLPCRIRLIMCVVFAGQQADEIGKCNIIFIIQVLPDFSKIFIKKLLYQLQFFTRTKFLELMNITVYLWIFVLTIIDVAVAQKFYHQQYILNGYNRILFGSDSIVEIRNCYKQVFTDLLTFTQLTDRSVIYPEINFKMLHHQQ